MVLDKLSAKYFESDGRPEVLERGKYHGYDYYICFSHICPTAYVKLAANNRFYGNDFLELDKLVGYRPHGCYTYSDYKLGYEKLAKEEGWFIGWDYGHAEDCFRGNLRGGKMWTMDEIRTECRRVIDSIIEKNSRHH